MQKNEGDDKITGIGRRQEEEDKVTELPEIPQLQHLAKNRPKRPKKHASTKNVVKVAIFLHISIILIMQSTLYNKNLLLIFCYWEPISFRIHKHSFHISCLILLALF